MSGNKLDESAFHSARPGETGRFRKRDRILNVGEFRRVYRHGFHATTSRFGCYVLPTRRRHSRLGLSVSRKYGKAPKRNRIKRQLREVFRRLRGAFPAHLDVVVVPRRAAQGCRLGQVASDFDELVRRALERRQRRR